MRRVVRGLLAVGAVVCSSAPAARAAETNVVIQGFEFRPGTVEVSPGDVVAWTNVDATVHTVTAEDGSFDSGRLDQGKRYAVAFNRSGTYAYFCDLHDFHRGTVVVRGAATPSSTTSTTRPTSTPTTAARQSSGGSTAPPGSAPPTTTDDGTTQQASGQAAGGVLSGDVATETVAGARPPDAGPPAVSVVVAPTAAAPAPLAPGPVVTSIVALIGAIALLARRLSSRTARVWRTLVAAMTLVSGYVHLRLRLTVSYPEPTASLFLAQAAATGVVAGALALSRSRIAAWFGIALHAGSIVAFVLTRTTGLFGFQQSGFDPSPEAAIAVGSELAALALLTVVLGNRWHALPVCRFGQTENGP